MRKPVHELGVSRGLKGVERGLSTNSDEINLQDEADLEKRAGRRNYVRGGLIGALLYHSSLGERMPRLPHKSRGKGNRGEKRGEIFRKERRTPIPEERLGCSCEIEKEAVCNFWRG